MTVPKCIQIKFILYFKNNVKQHVYTSICGDRSHDGNKNNLRDLRTIEAQIVQKLKNNEHRLKFTGS